MNKGISQIKLPKPAQRALQNAGISTLKQLTKLTESEISQWHGIGPNAIKEIKKTLKVNGMSFAAKS
jgi:hypothetical protein